MGKYVTRDQVGDNARIGTFTAAANFTATFGANDVDNTLEGRLTDFRNASGPLAGWSAYLGGANNLPAAFTGGALTGQPTSATIGGVAGHRYNGTLPCTARTTPAERIWPTSPMLSPSTRLPATRRRTWLAWPAISSPLATLTATLDNVNDATAAIAGTFGATPQ